MSFLTVVVCAKWSCCGAMLFGTQREQRGVENDSACFYRAQHSNSPPHGIPGPLFSATYFKVVGLLSIFSRLRRANGLTLKVRKRMMRMAEKTRRTATKRRRERLAWYVHVLAFGYFNGSCIISVKCLHFLWVISSAGCVFSGIN